MNNTPNVRDKRTITDFGDQWSRYQDSGGWYGSQEMLADIFGPLLTLNDIRDKYVAEIGSGSGRIVNMLIMSDVKHIVAIEPSNAFPVLQRNTKAYGGRVECLHLRGDRIPQDRGFDYVFSIGVLHHIEDPAPSVKAAYGSLKSGGKMLIWIYGREGNETYLKFVEPMRRLTSRLSAPVLAILCHLINLWLAVYIGLCRLFPLPLHSYVNNVLVKLSWRKRHLIIYDQLNPTVAHYYHEGEARELLEQAGFQQVRLHHRHGYSWTVIGTKPE